MVDVYDEDPECERLRWAAETQQQAQEYMRQAAQETLSVIGVVQQAYYDLEKYQTTAIKQIQTPLFKKLGQLAKQSSQAVNDIRKPINSALLNYFQDQASAVKTIQSALSTGLQADGKTAAVMPFYAGPDPGTVQVFDSPAGGQAAFKMPPAAGGSPATGGSNAPNPASMGSTTPAGNPPPPATDGAALLQSLLQNQSTVPLPSPTGPPGATAQAIANVNVTVSPQSLEQPLSQATLGDFARVLCACLSASNRQAPVDLDTPLAFLFGERDADWHRAAEDFYGEPLRLIMDASTLRDLLDLQTANTEGTGAP